MKKRNFHSVPFGNNWVVKKEGVKTPISVHKTQKASEQKTQKLSRQNKTEAVYHKKDGTIKDKDSYGNDPNPPIDRKH